MVETLGYIFSVAPFVAAGVCLLVLGWSAARAGSAALATAFTASFIGPGLKLEGIPGALVNGLGTVAEVLYVLGGGLLLYNVLREGGAVKRVSRFLVEVEPEREALALLVVVGAAPFFESVTGFGVAVVISAPILLGAGFSPLRSAALASWGQVVVPWGALAVGTVIGANLAGLGFGTLSNASAWLSLPLFPVYGIAAVTMAGGWRGLRRHGLEAVYVSVAAGVGILLSSLYLLPEMAGATGSLLAVAVFLAPRARRLRGLAVPGRSLAPYGLLLALLLIANSIGPVKSALMAMGPVFSGPGAWLLISAGFAALLLRLNPESVASAVSGTLRQWLPVAGAILTFILAGQVVASSGAASLLAHGATKALGGAYPAVAPLIGALGGALTGSNAGSNAMFMPFQAEAANASGSSKLALAALQNVSGSQANLLAPQRIVLAATATGLLGKEREIVRTVAPPVVASLVVLVVTGIFLT